MPPHGPLVDTADAVDKETSKKSYTWQEVAKHNTSNSCWVYCKDKVYDITPWLDRHPGGKEMLLLSAGRDITDMLPSYHPFSDKPEAVLASFEIGTIKSTEFPRYKQDTGFYKALRKRVGEYFERTGKDPKDPSTGLVILAAVVFVAYWSFLVAYDPTFSWFVRILAAQLFGVCQALPLLHVMHDASHTAISSKPLLWRIVGRFALDWFSGASFTSWLNQHVVGHHVYTNVIGADPDLPVERSGDLRRVSRQQYWCRPYRFQHYYLLFLYGLLGLKFRVQDIVGVLTARNGPIRVNQEGYSDHVWQLVVKATWFCWRILLPVYMWQTPVWHHVVLFLISEFVTGYWLAFNFQVSHVSPSAVFPDITTSFDDEWAVAQVKTTVDYAHGNKMVTFLSGALNYQTVHHLFPCVSQYHYPAIAPIVKEVCQEHGVPFTHLPTFWQAFTCHIIHLRDMGVKALDAH